MATNPERVRVARLHVRPKTPHDERPVDGSANVIRALRAREALKTYAGLRAAGEPALDLLTDLLADLQHLCRLNDLPFATCLRRSQDHFDAEKGPADG